MPGESTHRFSAARDREGAKENDRVSDSPLHGTSVGQRLLAEAQNFGDARDVRVATTLENGKSRFAYELDADGQHFLLFTTDATVSGLQSAGKQLDRMAGTMVTQMESDPLHPIRFSRPGEDVVKKRVLKADGTYSDDGPMVKARVPKLDELYGIRAALTHSMPSNLLKDGTPVKIYFLSEPFIEGLGQNVAAQVIDKNSQDAIYMSPDGVRVSGARATEADLTEKERQTNWNDRAPSIEADVVHEFAHVEQSRLGLLQRGNDLDDSTASSMGWVHLVDDKQQIDSWMIKLQKLDAEGENILYRLDESSPFGAWVRSNAQGVLLDADRQPARGEPEKLSPEEVRKQALIKPPTWYFPNPCEEYAEAMKLFRLGAQSRTTLAHESPVLYALVKHKDQEEIDLHYGAGLWLRDLDGSLVPAAKDSRDRVGQFEAGMRLSF